MKFKNGQSLQELHQRAKRPYGEYVSLCQEVEAVYQGAFSFGKDVEDSEVQPGPASEGFSIIDEIIRLIVRGDRSFEVPLLSKNETSAEKRLTDHLERFAVAYVEYEQEITGVDITHDAAWWAALRGQSYYRTLYEKGTDKLPIIREVLDPIECFPAWSRRGVVWYTVEKTISRWELMEDFGKKRDRMQYVAGYEEPDLKALGVTGDWSSSCYDDVLTVTEYWDSEICAWAVNDHLVQEGKHGYDRMTFHPVRFGRTPHKKQRWAVKPILAPIRGDLMQLALSLEKIGTGVEMFYWPVLYAKAENGDVFLLPTYVNEIPVGAIKNIGENGQIGVVNPTPNAPIIEQYIKELQKRISKASITDLEQTNASGFAVSQFLNNQRTRLDDYIKALQTADGQSLGDVMYLHELFDEGQGWEYWLPDALEKRQQETIRHSDIAGHHKVRIRIEPSLPSDDLQNATIFNQLYTRDPVSGMLNFTWETAARQSGVANKIPNLSAEEQGRKLEWLINNDPESKQREIDRIKAENAGLFAEIDKTIERQNDKAERKAEREAVREIERGMSEDVLLPAEVLADPRRLDMFIALVKEGKLGATALQMVQGDGLPMGVPGMQPQTMTPENQALIDEAMAAMQGQQPEGPNGLTGYDGMNPMVQPAAMAGANPRMAVDQAQVAVDQAEVDQRRGGLPAPA